MIHLRTLDGIAVVVHPYLPVGRNIREILGALKDPDPAALTISADWTHLGTDAEVVAFLQMTKSKPIRLLVVLHRAAGGPPNTFSPNPLEPYFPVDKFESLDEYDNPAEDSDVNMRNIAGVARRRMPTKDHTFEERKHKIRERIRRQQETPCAVKLEHR